MSCGQRWCIWNKIYGRFLRLSSILLRLVLGWYFLLLSSVWIIDYVPNYVTVVRFTFLNSTEFFFRYSRLWDQVPFGGWREGTIGLFVYSYYRLFVSSPSCHWPNGAEKHWIESRLRLNDGVETSLFGHGILRWVQLRKVAKFEDKICVSPRNRLFKAQIFLPSIKTCKKQLQLRLEVLFLISRRTIWRICSPL